MLLPQTLLLRPLPHRLASSCHALGHAHRLHQSAPSTQTHYQCLGLDSNATSDQIKTAYFDLSKLCHPDLKPGDAEALAQFQAISEAYDVLSNPQLRRKYDRGQMGRTSSVADREATRHKFQGDSFYNSRRDYQDEFSSIGGRKDFVKDYASSIRQQTFKEARHRRKTKSVVADLYEKRDRAKASRADPGSGSINVVLLLLGLVFLFSARG